MALIANIVVGIVALLHGYFLVLEMFLWDKPHRHCAVAPVMTRP